MKDAARAAALAALEDVERNNAWTSQAAAKAFAGLENRDRRFANELMAGCVENKLYLDWVINSYVSNTNINLKVRLILRMGVYQILFMDRVPDSAACSTSVELAKIVGKSAQSGFINGVLRNVVRSGRELKLPDDELQALSVKYSYPMWILQQWKDELGIDKTRELVMLPRDRRLSLRFNILKGGEENIQAIKQLGYGIEAVDWLKNAYMLSEPGGIFDSQPFQDGCITVQGLASQWVAMLAAKTKPKRVWDACAAPGGKTAALAAALGKNSYILATDLRDHRLGIMQETLDRLGADWVKVKAHDALEPLDGEEQFDLVLVDAPCSGLGTLAANPDIKYKQSPEKIAALQDMQLKMLRNLSRYVKPGGRLIYSTCTVSLKENKHVAKKFLMTEKDFVPKNIDVPLPPGIRGGGNQVQFLPSDVTGEGFFAALFERKN